MFCEIYPGTTLHTVTINNICFNRTDARKNREHRAAVSDSYAMEWASNTHSCYYRTGYDLSIPLFPRVLFPELAHIPPGDREYFVTFKVNSVVAAGTAVLHIFFREIVATVLIV